ncbi:HypC/HybG/HupF family hydrogenase formation chaperone [Cytobacillus firmus]|uniref:HypC/HybG/HupF family hydrogenase formation chaperone n=1 Tax=Cytobacillus firmus TaxID=1399 RepID=UPI0018CE4152|nr:HypC/HybG/HupF family hydrogenase formation chaperone [Cytobacillus firmus]MBG9443731.1 hydrogenase assembly protein HypC [Cytobacillus firmus]MBY6053927.1 HypC/HybG/HupF family hydrogenase formation chaperone [Cytobacillus firmus]WHY63980.1 HypC/HybG/HupF family hydrogenase formation chaperone [Cytobacillus firmus]
MCVGVPSKVIKLEENRALVDVMGSKIYVGILFVPEVKINDYVLLHAGQAMTIINEEYARESIEEWRKIIDGQHGTLF